MASHEAVREPNRRAPGHERALQHNNPVQEPFRPIARLVWAPEQVRGRGDREVARIAAAQRGIATREQLLAAGLGRGSIVHRLRTGRLRAHYRGVYLVDRVSMEPLGEEMAAVLHFGGHAILSHRSAAVMWGLLEAAVPVTLTVVGKEARARHGLRLHRVPHLDRRDLRLREGLPVTSPTRTLIDLAAKEPDAELEEAVAVAFQRGLSSPDEIRATIERAPRRKGVSRLQRLLEGGSASGYTRSKAERRMRSLLRAAELPQPRANVPMHGYVADFLWPGQRLIVEVDSFRFHSSRSAFEHDRKRDQRFAAAGYVVIRVTWRQLEQEPFAVIARIAQALAARAVAA
jgi:very-short-patch-repair endonuclease